MIFVFFLSLFIGAVAFYLTEEGLKTLLPRKLRYNRVFNIWICTVFAVSFFSLSFSTFTQDIDTGKIEKGSVVTDKDFTMKKGKILYKENTINGYYTMTVMAPDGSTKTVSIDRATYDSIEKGQIIK